MGILNQYTGSEVQRWNLLDEERYVLNNQRFVYCCEHFKPEGINTV